MTKITNLYAKPKFKLWSQRAIVIIAGALTPLALAPYNLITLGIVCPAVLGLILNDKNTKQSFYLCFLFGLGLFGAGSSWVFVAIHEFAYTPFALAFVMTALFVATLAFFFSFPLFLISKIPSKSFIGYSLIFSCLWVLGEWTRSWFLTGFPWLYLGYAHIDTWLAAWAPILGVFGLSFFSVLSGSLLLYLGQYIIRKKEKACRYAIASSLLILCIPWLSGLLLSQIDWQQSTDNNETISVAIIQPNIPQELKWSPFYLDKTLDILRDESNKHWDKDLLIWPEAAIPIMYHEADAFLTEMAELAAQNNSGIVTGILFDEAPPDIYYNAIIGLGRAEGIYFKQRLVPFGEYVPLEKYLRGIIAFFDLPTSIIFPGPKRQNALHFDDKLIAPSICYEIVYPDLVAKLARDSAFLITISNDAWFGDSIGPMQHFQMARMRALENQRYVIRATNTGISGVIDPQGNVVVRGSQFTREVVSSEEMNIKSLRTIFSFWGSYPIVIFCIGVLAFLYLKRKSNGPS